jgi:transmembrane sensor
MKPNSTPDAIRAAASRWLVRRDRGLSSAESIEYELWLAADERHAAAIKRSTAVWSMLDGISEPVAAPVLARVTRRRSFWRRAQIFSSLATAAALVFGVIVWRRPAAPALAHIIPLELSATSGPRTVTLSDGSLVHLNTSSEVIEQFTPAERHVLLVRGEAHFSVTKNPARPFIVRAGALQVRAVGTAFNVHLQDSGVDVLVTEGRVQLASGPSLSTSPASIDSTHPAPALNVGERAVLRGNLPPTGDLAASLVISHVDTAEIARSLAWREPLLRLRGSSLAELAAEFQRATGRRLTFADPAIGELRFGGRFRADDIDGFTHLLATQLDLEVVNAADGTIVLRKKKSD